MQELYIGLISGTSADGVDAVLAAFDNRQIRLVATALHPYPASLRTSLLRLIQGERVGDTLDTLGTLDVQLGRIFAEAAQSVAAHAGEQSVLGIGSHGQTVRHRPDGTTAFTLQIADPNTIASLTGIPTVADFRRRDVMEGGQGAPLVPAFHQAVFATPEENRVVVNIGGIANISTLPTLADKLSGFDTGPGNCLMDIWANRHLGTPYDKHGAWGGSGKPDTELLSLFLGDEYFQRQPPKSTGREYFNMPWLERKLQQRGGQLAGNDVQATLCELTARSICNAIISSQPDTSRVLVCGGGSHNAHLMNLLEWLMPAVNVDTTAAYGVAPDWVEATAFAWLAKETLAGRPGNIPAVTGAKRPAVLGGIYNP